MQVRPFRAPGIRSGKAEGFMNSKSDEAEASSSSWSSSCYVICREDQRKIVYFSSLLSKGKLEWFASRLIDSASELCISSEKVPLTSRWATTK